MVTLGYTNHNWSSTRATPISNRTKKRKEKEPAGDILYVDNGIEFREQNGQLINYPKNANKDNNNHIHC